MTKLRSASASMALGFVLLAVAAPANGAMTTYDVTFSANTFQVGAGSDPAPVDPVTGEFKISLDPTVSVINDTADISLTSLNIALDSPLAFTYNPAQDGGFAPGTLRVGGLADGADSIIFNPSTNDFWLQIFSFATAPAFEQVGYTQTSVSDDNLFYTINNTGSVTVTPLVAAPEPTTFCLASCGLVLLGFSSRRRKVQSL
jgi:PEP-CTERM motif-containing protein